MLKGKISSDSGATLVLALVFFLLCAVAGSIILIAGSGAAGRMADLKDDQQAYYSVTSAAKLFEDQMAGQKYLISSGGSVSARVADGHKDGALQVLLREGLASAHDSKNYTVKDCKLRCQGDSKLDVTFDFIMNEGYYVTILVKRQGTGEDKVQYQCTLKARATTKTNSNNSVNIDWNKDSITVSK
ncbi:MAG: hypothetical protein GX663_09800 [Clostridiales bacterium]|nr:hypothetical protein [Clostridiales bacterium]